MLVIQDYLTGYTWFTKVKPDRNAAMQALSKWIASFGGTEWIETYQGGQFKAEAMRKKGQDAHIKHGFMTENLP